MAIVFPLDSAQLEPWVCDPQIMFLNPSSHYHMIAHPKTLGVAVLLLQTSPPSQGSGQQTEKDPNAGVTSTLVERWESSFAPTPTPSGQHSWNTLAAGGLGKWELKEAVLRPP